MHEAAACKAAHASVQRRVCHLGNDDSRALQAIREAALQIGRDISLIGFDVHDELGLTTPKITTIRQPEMEIGVQTGQLLNPAKYGAPDSTQVLTQVYLQQGDSVASI